MIILGTPSLNLGLDISDGLLAVILILLCIAFYAGKLHGMRVADEAKDKNPELVLDESD